jgi:hypothetical protein
MAIADGQDLYNIYPTPNYSDAYANADSTCRGNTEGLWVPPPGKQLEVDVFGENGVVAPRAWPASCKSSSFQFFISNGLYLSLLERPYILSTTHHYPLPYRSD